jgi:hypothetical protein
MKKFFLLPLIALTALPITWALALGNQNPQTPPSDGSQIAVISFKWSKSQQTTNAVAADNPIPARAMTQNDKNLERNARINDPAGRRDPNADTVDARAAALEKSVQSAQNPQTKSIDGFAYQAKIHNTSKQVVEVIFWEYQFSDPAKPGEVTRRQFLCGVNIKPDKEKELMAFSASGPPSTVNAQAPNTPFQEKVIINRVEFADGKSWMRKDWNAGEIKAAYQRAMATPWDKSEMCRGL